MPKFSPYNNIYFLYTRDIWNVCLQTYKNNRICQKVAYVLTLFRMSFFGAAYGYGGSKKAPLPKICHTYPAMMKLGTVIPYIQLYLKNIKHYVNHVTHPLISAEINIFSPEISNFWYIKKYRYRLHFGT